MEYLLKNEQLELKYVPGKGAWTYHIQIPNSKHIKGKWGFLKVSGFIDDYEIESKNLFTIRGQDKLLSINQTIRKAIKKSGGDMVTVTLSLLEAKEQVTEKQILETFKESGVLEQFQKLTVLGKEEILDHIISQNTEDKLIKAIVKYIDKLCN
jgi:ribosomal protein S8